MKINKLHIFIFFLFFMNTYLFSQDITLSGSSIYNDPYAGFSFFPPPSFREVDRPSHMFVGVANKDYVPIISFSYTIYEDSLNELIDAIVLQHEIYLRNFNLLSRTDFITNNNIIGKRFMITHETGSRIWKQTHYCFARGNVKIIISCTFQYADEEMYDRMFDESIMTFQWIN